MELVSIQLKPTTREGNISHTNVHICVGLLKTQPKSEILLMGNGITILVTNNYDKYWDTCMM